MAQVKTNTNAIVNEQELEQKINNVVNPLFNSLEQRLVKKQDKLVSGSNIKEINNTSLLGSGSITLVSDLYLHIITMFINSETYTGNLYITLTGKSSTAMTKQQLIAQLSGASYNCQVSGFIKKSSDNSIYNAMYINFPSTSSTTFSVYGYSYTASSLVPVSFSVDELTSISDKVKHINYM